MYTKARCKADLYIFQESTPFPRAIQDVNLKDSSIIMSFTIIRRYSKKSVEENYFGEEDPS